MKKIITLLLALALVLSLAACGNNGTTSNHNNEEANVPASALELLNTVWNSYGEDEKFYALGGDAGNPVENAPGAYSLADPEAVTATLMVPATEISKITEASSLMNGMMANNFTCGAYRLAEGTDAKAFAKAMNDAIGSARWICGMPEKMMVAVIGAQYVVAGFGLEDSMNTFHAKLTAAYPNTEVLHWELIVE